MRQLLLVGLVFTGALAMADEPGRTSYATLTIEELAMRFRFVSRYIDAAGDPAPRDMAVNELITRKKLKLGTPREEVEFLLGKPAPEDRPSETRWDYGMLGGGLRITFDANGAVAKIEQHRDGEPDVARTADLLAKADRPAAAAAEKPTREAALVVPRIRELLRGGQPSLAALKGLLGEPDRDAGSGIHIFTFALSDGTAILVGAADPMSVMYVDHDRARLFPAESGEPR
jgi:hypothetical protein